MAAPVAGSPQSTAMATGSSKTSLSSAPRPPAEVPSSDLFRLDKRTIVITGGIGAIGLTAAIVCLEQGADVVLLDLPPNPPSDEADDAYAYASWVHALATAKQHGHILTYHQLDVTSASSVNSVFSHVDSTARWPVRGLVTCAGVSDRRPAATYPVDAFRQLFDINVTGTFLCAQAAANVMRSRKVAGSMVLIASMSGTNVNLGVDTCAYNSSKSAVLQLARNLAAEWGGGWRTGEDGVARVMEHLPITVNTLSPGYIRTNATGPTLAQMPHLEDVWEKGNMLGRLAIAHELRAPILFLLADGNSFMTAADLRVDGGHCAW